MRDVPDYQAMIEVLDVSLKQFNNATKKLKEYEDYYEDTKQSLDKEEAKLKLLKENDKKEIIQLAKERQIGFPTLAKAYDEFFALQDKRIIEFLQYKSHPAVESSKIIQNFASQRRRAVAENKILRYLIDYYESVAPFLADLREEVEDITEEDRILLADFTEDEIVDPTTNYLTKEEYRNLSSVERNQMALDRYWARPKSHWHVGKMYERYIGYLFEKAGYEVDYFGITERLEDLGRDIIAKKGDEVVIVQCKNWAKFKTIYEKHVFQFFGTVFQYKYENPSKNVRAEFYTTTRLSPLAAKFADELHIHLKDNFKMDKAYPCIKCNISLVNGSRIYHLPFDQMYDKTKIKNSGEFYCQTVAEAEEKGFRRAFRFKGVTDSEA